MGALIGSLYGVGHPPGHLERFAMLFRRKYYLDITVPKMGFVAGKKVKELIKMLSKGKRLEDLHPPVAVVATDLKRGERVVFRQGEIAAAVRASIAIPGIFVPEIINGKILVDGGVIDRVPVSIVKDMGADVTIAVDVSGFRIEPNIMTIYDVLLQSMDIMAHEMIRHQELDCSVMIRPTLDDASSLVFTRVEQLIEQGYKAAYSQMDKIKLAIEKGN